MFRHNDQVDMVGHQAVTNDLRAVPASVSGQQIQVEAVITKRVEYPLAIVAALRQVMRYVRNDDARTSGHESEVGDGGVHSLKMRLSPFACRPFCRRPNLMAFASLPARKTRRRPSWGWHPEASTSQATALFFTPMWRARKK